VVAIIAAYALTAGLLWIAFGVEMSRLQHTRGTARA
jgi:hypothetical protein